MICLDGKVLFERPNVLFTEVAFAFYVSGPQRNKIRVSSEKANGIKNVRVTIPGRTAAKEG